MLDQTFSARNFLLVSEAENRRGSNLNSTFFPDVKKATEEVKVAVNEVRQFRKTHKKPYSDADKANYDLLLEERSSVKQDRDATLFKELSEVAKRVSAKSFYINFDRKPGPKAKPVCVLNGSAESYYATKLISRNIHRLYNVKQANKNLISSQICNLLNDSFPYYVARFDITEFYESIDQRKLREKLQRDQLLSATSLKLINGVLQRYGTLAGTPNVGLPRGIGISAFLSELFMRDFDSEIQRSSEVVYYARYVDDVVVVFAPTKSSNLASYKTWLDQKVQDYGLSMNSAPGKSAFFLKSGGSWAFDYLGYNYVGGSKSVTVALSSKKFSKYQSRIRVCFKDYDSIRNKNRKQAHRLLVQRLTFLTGNSQLSHSKQNAFVGIFFSNPHLTTLTQLKQLDALKKQLTHSPHISAKLKDKLDKLSFVNGYDLRTFRSFRRDKNMKRIVEVWKYVQ